MAIGIAGGVTVSASFFPFVAVGAFLVLAYNLELFGGAASHRRVVRAGVGRVSGLHRLLVQRAVDHRPGVVVTAACYVLSVAQRRLSTPVRELRRRTVAVSGVQELSDGRRIPLTPARLAAPLDGALSALSLAVVLLACSVVVARL